MDEVDDTVDVDPREKKFSLVAFAVFASFFELEFLLPPHDTAATIGVAIAAAVRDDIANLSVFCIFTFLLN